MNWNAFHLAVLAAVGVLVWIGPLSPEGVVLIGAVAFATFFSGVSLLASAVRQLVFLATRRRG